METGVNRLDFCERLAWKLARVKYVGLWIQTEFFVRLKIKKNDGKTKIKK